ncbi:MAG: NTP transferase domain-containing protein [Planctomycetes bacterium]|nr:NTP transferase domain-containing protein [Planctomycetota bacterium]MCB9891289.1 NTP transferase domain-containing protein [Planctomycetota bacterium]MCB9919452.1 NTP transferase domain-containing protein [Planctomycetota bacterium]
MTFVTVVLAAGDSTRMGTPKALLRIENRTAIEHIVANAASAGSCDVIVCTSKSLASELPEMVARVLVVPEDERSRGPIASIRHGLTIGAAAIDEIPEAWVVWPVDHPFVEPATLHALLDAPGPCRTPTYEGRGGHPIVISEGAREHLLEFTSSGATLRDFFDTKGRAAVEVEDPGVRQNCDTLATFTAYFEAYRRRYEDRGSD